MMPAPGWKPGQIINKDDGCPDMEANIGAFAMPGLTAGTTSPAFLGGSNLAISAKSKNPDLAIRAAEDPGLQGLPEAVRRPGHDPGAEVAARRHQR